MTPIKPFRPNLRLEDMINGGSPKLLNAINQGVDFKKCKKLVREIKALNLERTDFNYLKTALIPLLNGYFSSSVTSNTGELIYRAVPWQEKPTNKTQLSYPPAPIVKLGRANNPERPLFYGSAGCHSTILELNPKQGDRLAISKWRTNQNLNLFCVGYTETAFKGKSGINRFENLPWVKQHAADSSSNKHGNQFLHEFLAHEFTKRVTSGKEWQYKISAAISELAINALSYGVNDAPAIEIAGILYPSTPNEANADNVAVKCSIADLHLEFVSVQYIEVSGKTNDHLYTIQGIDYADSLSDTGDIEWKGSFPPRLFAGTDHNARTVGSFIEILNNKNTVVGRTACNKDTKLSLNFPTITNQ